MSGYIQPIACACCDHDCIVNGCKLNRQRYTAPPQGCICPPTSEQTCGNPTCPRRRPSWHGPIASGMDAETPKGGDA